VRFAGAASAPVSFREALFAGLAPDGSLYRPVERPDLSRLFAGFGPDTGYPDLAARTTAALLAPEVDEPLARRIADRAFTFSPALRRLDGRRQLLELFHGPTCAFKDFGAQFLAAGMEGFVEAAGQRIQVLVATSGDTGSAVAHAYFGVDRVRVVVLFPVAEVSNRQRKQMTTLGGNVTTFAVDGKFDDCQALVKRAFADPDLAGMRLSSANSINVGRLLPQSVYYVYAYANLADAARSEPMVFSVPSGNFGDMMGAVIAKRMGVPMDRLVVATNANDEVPRFVRTGRYEKIVPSRVCISNAMNVGHPSNLARLVDAYGGFMDEAGALREEPRMEELRRDIFAVSITDDETRAAIKRAYEEHRVVLEPHGAVGWAGLLRYLDSENSEGDPLCVSVETAHPAKFPEEIQSLIGIDPEVPPSLRGIEEKPEQVEPMAVDYEAFREILAQRFGRR
jgi:threonine synthase